MKNAITVIFLFTICLSVNAQDDRPPTYRGSIVADQKVFNLEIEFKSEKNINVTFRNSSSKVLNEKGNNDHPVSELDEQILYILFREQFPLVENTESSINNSDIKDTTSTKTNTKDTTQKKDLKNEEVKSNPNVSNGITEKDKISKEMAKKDASENSNKLSLKNETKQNPGSALTENGEEKIKSDIKAQYLKAKAYYLDKMNNKDAEDLGLKTEEYVEYTALKKSFDDACAGYLKETDRPRRSKAEGVKKRDNTAVRNFRKQKRYASKSFVRYANKNVKPFIFLSGSALSVLNGGLNNDTIKSNVLALGFHGNKANIWDFDADITFSQAEDIVSGSNRNQFGTTVLVPGIRKFSLLTNFKLHSIFKSAARPFWSHIGQSASFNATQVSWKWSGPDSLDVNGNQAVRVVPLAINLMLNYNWVFGQKERVNVSERTTVSTDFGLAYRGVWGNAAQSQLLMKKFLGREKTNYWGVIGGLSVKIQRLTIFYSGVYIPGRRFGYVPGLTEGQVLSSLGFRADIVKL